MAKKPDYDPIRGGGKVPASSSVGVLFSWLGTRGDYSVVEKRDKAVTGWRRKISPATQEGRFRIVIATYLTTAIFGYYIWKRRSASKLEKEKS